MTDLIKHIKQLNNEAKEQMSNDPNLWIGLWSEDEKHWNDYEVYTVEDFKKYNLVCMISDGFKDIYGVRPRHLNLSEMTIVELEQELENLRNETNY